MKHLFKIVVLLFILSAFFACDNDDEKNDEAYMKKFSIINNDTVYEQLITGTNISGFVPYGVDRTTLVATFEVSEGASVYINNVPQVSGVTENDFTDGLAYTVISEDKKNNNTYAVIVQNQSN